MIDAVQSILIAIIFVLFMVHTHSLRKLHLRQAKIFEKLVDVIDIHDQQIQER